MMAFPRRRAAGLLLALQAGMAASQPRAPELDELPFQAARPGFLELSLAARSAAPAPPNPWREAASPSTGRPESLGGHSAGCLRGGAPLAASGPGYELMRTSRRRHYGHPRLVSYVRSLAAAAAALPGAGALLVGDLGQPRGGPTLSGHASHQSGLDVDVWYLRWTGARPLSGAQRESMDSPRMVVPDFEGLAASWDPGVVEVLALAADDPAVERIFVNPVVKREACRLHPGQAWLRRLRPWWSHDDHFHARLSCDPRDAACASFADPIPEGDGCGAELADWFTPEKKAEARRRRLEPSPPPRMPELPAECSRVLLEP